MNDMYNSFASRVNSIPESFIREILKVATSPDTISFAGGLPNPALFPVEQLADATEKVIRTDGRAAFQYASTEGYLPLRDYIAKRQSAKENLSISAEDVLVLSGSQQGLDLTGKLFCEKGNPILLEEPSYLGAIQAYSVYEPSFNTVPLRKEGVDPYDFRSSIRKERPGFFYCIPNFQNPTGCLYEMENRLGIVEEAHSHNVMIIEDNPYSDIFFNDREPHTFHSMIPDQTVYLGSFSKIVSPGLRLGWATGPKAVIKKMTLAKQASDLHSNHFAQRVLYQFLLDNNLEDHLERIREFYSKKAQSMSVLMKQYFPSSISWTEPMGGMFMWLVLPAHIAGRELLTKAMNENVLFVPGEEFFLDRRLGTCTARFNFSHPSDEALEKGLQILGRILSEMDIARGHVILPTGS